MLNKSEFSKMMQVVDSHPTTVDHTYPGAVPGYEISSGGGFYEVTLKAGDLPRLFPGFDWREYVTAEEVVAFCKPDPTRLPDYDVNRDTNAMTLLALCRESAPPA